MFEQPSAEFEGVIVSGMGSIGLVEIVDKGMVVGVDTTVVDSVAVDTPAELDTVEQQAVDKPLQWLEPDTADQPVELGWHQSISEHPDLMVFQVTELVPNL